LALSEFKLLNFETLSCCESQRRKTNKDRERKTRKAGEHEGRREIGRKKWRKNRPRQVCGHMGALHALLDIPAGLRL
jgi:hypothetical protein